MKNRTVLDRVDGCYFRSAFDDPKRLVKAARRDLKGVDFDTMVGTGMSGALVVPWLAREFEVHWLIVRKPYDDSHAGSRAEGRLGRRWLFVDDFIMTGTTKKRALKAVHELSARYEFGTTFVGAWTYEESDRGFVAAASGEDERPELKEPRAPARGLFQIYDRAVPIGGVS